MSTRFPSPKDNWSDAEWGDWGREVADRQRWGTFSFTAPEVGANAVVDTVIDTGDAAAVDGTRIGMPIFMTPPSTIDAGLVFYAWVAANNTITLRLTNITASPITTAAGTWAFQGMVQ